MIVVRSVNQVKFGKIDQAVELFASLPEIVGIGAGEVLHYHILTDISGPMYTLVEELVIPSLADWQPMRERLFNRSEFADWFKKFQQFIDSGTQQFYTIEGTCEEWSHPGVVVVREAYRALQWQIRPAVELLQRYGALMVDSGAGRNPRILTDLSGPMFTAVIEVETDGLSEWETQRRTMFRRPEFQVWFVQLLNAVEAGRHEFYRVEF
ncbi:MAG TPA: hypothetical protein VJG32_21420 [Anaerolineae bacterium]|nr:hypothetical protein [Anaerolineae bacterium]